MAITNPTPTEADPPWPPAAALSWRRGRRRPAGHPAWMEPPHPPAQIAKGTFLVLVAVAMLFPFASAARPVAQTERPDGEGGRP